MSKITVNTADRVVPMIYAYSTPEIERHKGWTKIGYTEQDVSKRIEQQSHTVDVQYVEEWRGNAIFEDGSGDVFTDKNFHAYLKKRQVEREPKTEWFHINGINSKIEFFDFKFNRGIIKWEEETIPYSLRAEQAEAVAKTVEYRNSHENAEFLWNAKPRFGKTLSVYDFCKQIGAQQVLIVTNRPAIANSWYSDYVTFLGEESGYLFVSSTDSLKEKAHVLTREEMLNVMRSDMSKDYKCITFLSLQDLKGSKYFGGKFDKLKEIGQIEWDVLVIDEAHEGVDTTKTDIAFDQIKRKFTLHLSGTPFKALANDKFPENAIYNWTYADEQTAKRDWDESEEEENPYANLPKLNMYTYQMSEIVKDELEQGIEIQGETEEYAFDLYEFFETDGKGKFVHNSSVDKFLDALTTQEKFPFSTPELRDELKHTFWLLNRVSSAEALAKKLQSHPIFKDYEIVLAAGDGKLDDAEENQKAFDRVKKAIAEHDKTITLSVGQLTTGVTIPEWTAVLMLSNIKSPALYMQAAFRAQNPCLFKNGASFYRKKNAYVFDFDPARTLVVYEQFANDLSAGTAAGKGDIEEHKENILRLLNFFPVIGEDDQGEMIALDAEKVLSIPRKIKSQEVVRRGFMSNYLFQNIANVFNAPREVIDILQELPPVPEPKTDVSSAKSAAEDLSLDENGDVKMDEEVVIGTASDLFGEKIYEPLDGIVDEVAQETAETANDESSDSAADTLKETLGRHLIDSILSTVKSNYGGDIKAADTKAIERKVKAGVSNVANKVIGNYDIKKKTIEQERIDALQNRFNTGESTAEIEARYEKMQEEASEEFKSALNQAVIEYTKEATVDAVKTVETNIKEREKSSIEDAIRDHLRGFTRTIPSFLMAYGTEEVTLGNFDTIIPDAVFQEVTSITLAQFRFLRDGGDYIEQETGEQKHFGGNLFDPIVFNDSVKAFLKLKRDLGNYFAEEETEDIFDYIPPQKTNQIYTPKKVVKQMVDMLEEENPGCFDCDDKTFIDLYMKSGLYISEIVKRLYRSSEMKRLHPDPTERLDHIFEKQVFGLAPTEIIYRIATSYILGFDDVYTLDTHNFRQVDALQYAKEGTLSQKLDELFGDMVNEKEKEKPVSEKEDDTVEKSPVLTDLSEETQNRESENITGEKRKKPSFRAFIDQFIKS